MKYSSIFAVFAVVFSHFALSGFSSEIGYQYPHGSLSCKLQSETVWDCNNRMLEYIPSHVLSNTSTNRCVDDLFLNHNRLENITDAPFRNLVSLTWLDLGYNMISVISEDAFVGLHQLEYLQLSNNRLVLLDKDVFYDLTKLNYLGLNFNMLRSIPSHALAPLKSLRELFLCGNNIVSFALGKEFQNMTQLTFLDFEANQINPLITSSISNKTFQNLNVPHQSDFTLNLLWDDKVITNVTSFGSLDAVKHLDINGIPDDDFTSIKGQLKSLTLSNFDFGNSTVEPFRFTERWNSTLKKLSFMVSLAKELPQPLFHWTPQLRILDVSYHFLLRSISDDAFYGLNYLQELILSHNSLLEVPTNALRIFTEYRTLRKIDLSYNKITGTIPADAFAAVPFITHLNFAGNDKISFRPDWTAVLVNLAELNLQDTFAYMFYAKTMPSLTVINLGVPTGHVHDYDLRIPNKMCTIAPSIKQALIPNYPFITPVKEILGLQCPNLLELDISGCFTHSETYAIQQEPIELTILEQLNMARNKLQSLLDITFIKAPQLLYLDVSDNEIQTIDSTVLSMFMNITYLKLNRNKLVSLNGLQHLHCLQNLYASQNKITFVPHDLLYRENKLSLFILDLGNNPFDCTCNISSFQHWILEDSITFLIASGPYICTTPENIKGLSITEVDLDCKSKLPIYIGVGAACLLVLTICITTAVYYRWHIKYKFFLVFKRRYKRYTSFIDDAEERLDDLNYDAYVAYDDGSLRDEYWVINDLRINLEEGPQPFRICIKGRDFIPGGTIVDTIQESIQRSRRTILILTQSFVDSEWCYFEMQMARMRLYHENRDVLILVMLEEIPDNKLTLSLRQLLCRQEYFKWPLDQAGQDLFWRRLREEIKKPVQVDRRHDP